MMKVHHLIFATIVSLIVENTYAEEQDCKSRDDSLKILMQFTEPSGNVANVSLRVRYVDGTSKSYRGNFERSYMEAAEKSGASVRIVLFSDATKYSSAKGAHERAALLVVTPTTKAPMVEFMEEGTLYRLSC